MNSKLGIKITYIGISLIEIILTVASFIIYSSVFIFFPLDNIVRSSTLIPIAVIFLILLTIFSYLSKYIFIPDRKKMMTVVATIVSITSIILMEIWDYPYSLVRILSIFNTAFNIIIFCELTIYFKSLLKK